MTDKSDRVVLRYDIDESSLNRAIARVNAARQRIAEIRGTLTQINQAAKPTGDTLRTVFDSAEKSASKLSQRLDEVAKKSTRLRGTLPSQQQSIGDLRTSLASGSGGGALNALNRTEGAVSRTGAALRGLGLGPVGDIVSGGGDLLQLVGSLGQLGPAAGIAAAGVAGFAVGLKIAEESSKDAKRALDSLLSTQEQYYKAVETMTTDQVQTEIAVLERRRKIQQEATNESERALAILEKQTGISRNVGIAAPGQLGDAFRQLTGQLDENKKAVSDTDISLGRFTGGLKSNAFAANDAAEAERKLTEARVKSFQESIDQRKQLSGITTQDEIDERTASLQTQININQKWLTSNAERIAGDETLAATFDKVEEETKKLQRELEGLSGLMPSVISNTGATRQLVEVNSELNNVRQRETQFIEKATEAMNAFADETERVADERRIAATREGQDFTIKRGRDQAEFTRRQAESDAAYYKDRGKRVAAFNREFADSDNEAQKARAKAIQEANAAQIQAAEDFARTVRGFTEQINDAGANLDAVGVRNAQRGLKDATDQYNAEKRKRDADAQSRIKEIADNAKEQKDARAAAFAEELADADAQHAAERQKEQEEFARRLQIEDQDRALRLQRQQEDYNRQDAQRKSSFDRQVQNLRTQLLEPEEREKIGSYGRQRAALNDFLNGAVNDVNAAKARVTTSSTSASQANRTSDTVSNANRVATVSASQSNRTSATTSTRKLIGFAHGGRPPIGVPVMINEGRPEPVIFGSPAQVGGNRGFGAGGINVGDIYLNGGLAPEQYKAMVKQGIAEAFTEAMN